MKKFGKLLVALLVGLFVVVALVGCDDDKKTVQPLAVGSAQATGADTASNRTNLATQRAGWEALEE